MSLLENGLLLLAFGGLALMGAGVFWRDERSHLLRAAGWVVFGLYWPFQSGHYFDNDDPFNAYASLFAPVLTGYIAYHEVRSHQWKEDPVALRWLTGATFIAALTYFVLFEIKPIQEIVIYYTGVQSSWVSDLLFGTNSVAYQEPFVGPEGYRGTHICLSDGYYRGAEATSSFCGAPFGSDSTTWSGAAAAGFPYYAVTIIFACTALQSIMIFVGAIGFTAAPWKRKFQALMVTVPTIYVLNLIRNAGIVFGYRVKGYTMFGLGSFEFMHSWVGKTGSLVALILIALAVFRLLPELHENILDVIDLPKRRRSEPPGGGGSPAAATAANPE